MVPSDQSSELAWALSPGHAGMEGQAIALLEALNLPHQVKRISPKPPWTWFPGSSWPFPMASLPKGGERLAPPYPGLIVSCGRRAAPFAAVIAKRSKGATKTVHIQNPQSGTSRFDILVVPEHDQLSGGNVITSVGSLHRVTQAKLTAAKQQFEGQFASLPAPRITVLLGGSTKHITLDAAALSDLGARAAKAATVAGGSLMITGSRRSDPAALAAFKAKVASVPHQFWQGEGENPYFGMLGWADRVLATGDSINMICEACSTGRPVYIARFGGTGKKFDRFYRTVTDRGHARFFEDDFSDFSAIPLRETERVAALVSKRLSLTP